MLKDVVSTNVIISLLAGKYTIVSCPKLFDWLESFCTKSSQELIVETGPPGNMALENFVNSFRDKGRRSRTRQP